jgi:hypothetical protein
VPLKTEAQIEDVKYFTDLIQWTRWTATPETTCTTSSYDYPSFIKQKLAEKRRLRKEWHLHRTPTSKKLFNRATQELKEILHDHKNYNIQMSLNGLTPTASTVENCKKNLKKSLQLLHRFGRHKEHGQEPMLIKHRPSPFTLPLYSNLTHLNPTAFLTTP